MTSKSQNADKPCDDFSIFRVQDKLPYGCLATGKKVIGYIFRTHELPGAKSLS